MPEWARDTWQVEMPPLALVRLRLRPSVVVALAEGEEVRTTALRRGTIFATGKGIGVLGENDQKNAGMVAIELVSSCSQRGQSIVRPKIRPTRPSPSESTAGR